MICKLDPQTDVEASEQQDSGTAALTALEDVSRRLKDLARELNCLGYFDSDENWPRAA